MDTQFEGQVALITGGTSGIGRATAEALRARGAEVHVCDFKTRADAEQALQAQGISISQCDVRDVTAL
ncbi:MAG: SDR family NAD(P)-dependent oxidoreductase, partial [Planctomycetaceae bacterium]|nr:SDR family NAD(P)-dependent oxidoreductase [Planctomycetaceae bacterium]